MLKQLCGFFLFILFSFVFDLKRTLRSKRYRHTLFISIFFGVVWRRLKERGGPAGFLAFEIAFMIDFVFNSLLRLCVASKQHIALIHRITIQKQKIDAVFTSCRIKRGYCSNVWYRLKNDAHYKSSIQFIVYNVSCWKIHNLFILLMFLSIMLLK